MQTALTEEAKKYLDNRYMNAMPDAIYRREVEKAVLDPKFITALGLCSDQWISVEDAPLYITTNLGWECTENVQGDFWAAIPYVDKRHPGKDLWWIHRCVVEDEIGLCVVGEDENCPAGWPLQEVTHYIPINLPSPPTPKQP